MSDERYFIWYSLLCGAGSADGVRLLDYFDGDVRAIYEADENMLLSVEGISKSFLRRFTNKSTENTKNVIEFCFMNGIHAITCADEEYPGRLKRLGNRPIVLYAKGRLERLEERLCVGVVGTRSMSDYGKHAAFDIVRGLCAHDAVVVSGAAYGIDSVANQTAVYFESETIAVLGSGVNVPYPKENAKMLDQIAERGLVLSEFAPGTPPSGRNFPIRNRIISGLSDALVVVEADVKSGALITAELAKNQGRALYAVPGSIYSEVSRGTNELISSGSAKACVAADTLLKDFKDDFELGLLERFASDERYLRYELRSQARVKDSATRSKSSAAAKTETASTEAEGDASEREEARTSVKSSSAPSKRRSGSDKAREPGRDTTRRTSESQTESHGDLAAATRAQQPDSGLLALLKPIDRRVLEALSDTEAISPDRLIENGLSINEIMASLTVLELYDAVERTPSGMFRRRA